MALTLDLGDSQYAGSRTAEDAYQAAVDAIADKVLTTFSSIWQGRRSLGI